MGIPSHCITRGTWDHFLRGIPAVANNGASRSRHAAYDLAQVPQSYNQAPNENEAPKKTPKPQTLLTTHPYATAVLLSLPQAKMYAWNNTAYIMTIKKFST